MLKLTLVILLLSALSAGAEQPSDPVRVAIQSHAEAVDIVSLLPVAVTATSFDYPAVEVPPVEFQLEEEGMDVHLSKGRWAIQAEIDRLWSAPAQVTVGIDTEPVMLALWPAGFITGRLIPPRNEEPPGEMVVIIHPTPETDLDGKIQPASQKCALDRKGRFRCKVPAGELDLRFVISGFVHHFLWNIRVAENGEEDLGRAKLRRGSSVQGWIATEDGSELSEGTIRLQHRAYESSPSQMSRQARNRSLEEKVSPRGFFQIVGARPGEYYLMAEAEGYARTTTTVRVAAGRTSEVSPPLELRRPLDVDVYVHPPVDPWGRPWELVVKHREDPDAIVVMTLNQVTVPESGALPLSGFNPGRYVFYLQTVDRERYWGQEVEVDGNQGPIIAELDYVDVTGEVRLNDEPLESTLYFGGRYGGVRVEMLTDEEGRYQGFLPQSGEWNVTIDARDPPIDRTEKVVVEPRDGARYAEVDFDLPDGRIRGRVVDEKNRPVNEALVEFEDGSDFFFQATSDKRGRFELAAIDPGNYQVYASVGDLQSDTHWLRVTDEPEGAEIELILRPVAWVRGLVSGPDGPGIGGRVEAVVVDPVASLASPWTRTDAEGNYQFRLPAESQRMVLRVMVPGFAYRMLRLPVDERPVNIRLDSSAGTLVLGFDEAPAEVEGYFPYVFNNGGFVGLAALVYWGDGVDGVRSFPNATSYTIPMMEPGDYGLCMLSLEEARGFRASETAWQTSDRCVRGFLAVNGELRLEVASEDLPQP